MQLNQHQSLRCPLLRHHSSDGQSLAGSNGGCRTVASCAAMGEMTVVMALSLCTLSADPVTLPTARLSSWPVQMATVRAASVSPATLQVVSTLPRNHNNNRTMEK